MVGFVLVFCCTLIENICWDPKNVIKSSLYVVIGGQKNENSIAMQLFFPLWFPGQIVLIIVKITKYSSTHSLPV